MKFWVFKTCTIDILPSVLAFEDIFEADVIGTLAVDVDQAAERGLFQVRRVADSHDTEAVFRVPFVLLLLGEIRLVGRHLHRSNKKRN